MRELDGEDELKIREAYVLAVQMEKYRRARKPGSGK
jgi:hypothetical protein